MVATAFSHDTDCLHKNSAYASVVKKEQDANPSASTLEALASYVQRGELPSDIGIDSVKDESPERDASQRQKGKAEMGTSNADDIKTGKHHDDMKTGKCHEACRRQSASEEVNAHETGTTSPPCGSKSTRNTAETIRMLKELSAKRKAIFASTEHIYEVVKRRREQRLNGKTKVASNDVEKLGLPQ